MNKEEILAEIFNNDPQGLLHVKPKSQHAKKPDEKLLASFEEINHFVQTYHREPHADLKDMNEYLLHERLKGLRKDAEKVEKLKPYDVHELLPMLEANQAQEPAMSYAKPKELNSFDDIFADDSLGLFGDDDDLGLFAFKHIPRESERAETDFVAKRKPIKEAKFKAYKERFEQVHRDLKEGKRMLVEFKDVDKNLKEGQFYVLNGVLLYLESVDYGRENDDLKVSTAKRKDGRTEIIFENGTKSNMFYRSLSKMLYDGGRIVTQTLEEVETDLLLNANIIGKEDEAAGYIYVLRSQSRDPKIAGIRNLFKIGYSKLEVEERIKNAEKEPTYLMAPVHIKGAWKCFNMNPQKFEQLLHNFFGKTCVELDVFDEKGKRHTPREWFIAPFEVIEQAIELIINGKIVKYKYNIAKEVIERR